MTVVVVGMHRSGTSMVASVLHTLGVNMGDELLPPGHGNPLGFFEDVEFMKLNDRILYRAGGNWADPPARHQILLAGDSFEKEINAMIAKRDASGGTWGWKDPRTSLTAELFLDKLNDPRLIICNRNKQAIIDSLLARDDPFFFDQKIADLVTDEYQDRINLLRALGLPTLTVGYELCRAHPLEGARRIARFVPQLDADEEAVELAAAVIR